MKIIKERAHQFRNRRFNELPEVLRTLDPQCPGYSQRIREDRLENVIRMYLLTFSGRLE